MKIFAIFDRKAHRYLGLSTFDNNEVFMRNLSGAVNDPQKSTLLAAYPDDFEGVCLGNLDDRSGEIVPELNFVCNCGDLVNREVKKDESKN